VTRRNQARRRRNYGRRQHEVRERRGESPIEGDWWARGDEMSASDVADEQRQPDDGGYAGFAR
jgi:hypothetical protein